MARHAVQDEFLSKGYCQKTCNLCAATPISPTSSSPVTPDLTSDCYDQFPSDGKSCAEHKSWGNCSRVRSEPFFCFSFFLLFVQARCRHANPQRREHHKFEVRMNELTLDQALYRPFNSATASSLK